jgi:hypothetical protein
LLPRRIILTAVASATALLGFAAPALASTSPATTASYSASTIIKNRPDSGTKGNTWAEDGPFIRDVTITRHSEVSASNYPGTDTGKCYFYTFRIYDHGWFTTVAGQQSPRSGTNLDQALTGFMTGGTSNGEFDASWKNPEPKLVWKGENDHGQDPTGQHTTTNWVEQFFGPTAVFNSAANPGGPDLGSKADWTYRINFGDNAACPNDAYQWVDAAASGWGTDQTDGDILTPNAADCT